MVTPLREHYLPKQGNTFTAVLLYSSWCAFSLSAHSTFEDLASMYPQMEHLAVEKSSIMPRMQFRGSKDLEPFTKFHEKSTGYEPFQHTAVDEIPRLRSGEKYIMPLCIRSKMDEIWTREPYLFFSVFFLKCIYSQEYCFI